MITEVIRVAGSAGLTTLLFIAPLLFLSMPWV